MDEARRAERVCEAAAASDETLRAKVKYYRCHVGAEKRRRPGWLEDCRASLEIFEAELARRQSR